MARCQNKKDLEVLSKLFAEQGIHQWQPSQETLKCAFSLLEGRDANTLAEKLRLEHQTVNLLSSLLAELHIALENQGNSRQQEHEQSDTSFKEQIDSCLAHCATINDVATRLNMSTRTLQRKFKELYQIPASSYIKQRRMEEAKKALLIEDLSIGEAGFRAGYNHPSNFVSAFKKIYGLTPTEYKSAHRFD